MALPSQMPRTPRQAALRNGSQRFGKRTRQAGLISLVVVVLGLAIWWLKFAPDPEKQHTLADSPANAETVKGEKVALKLDEPAQGAASAEIARKAKEKAAAQPQTSAPTSPATVPGTIAATTETKLDTGAPASITMGSTPTKPAGTTGGANPNQPATTAPGWNAPGSNPTPANSGTTSAPATKPAGTGAPASNPATPPQSAQPVPSPTPQNPTGAPGTAPTSLSPETTTHSAGASGRDGSVQRLIDAADAAIAANRTVDARLSLNRALHDARTSESDRAMLRKRMSDMNDKMVFSPAITPGDPLVETYTVQSGDKLVKIVNMHDLKVDWRLVQRVNGMSDPGRLRVGQKLKLVEGPFHAVVDKSEYRLDIYANAVDQDGNKIFIRSFQVGLGEHGSTPVGKFVVRSGSKLVNPHWVNPRTGEKFNADDPKNPIGERWIGLDGADKNTQVLSGYGIHGTIDPSSIGKDMSMGCVRLAPQDIELVYELLSEGASTVEIRD